jgi:lipopolysaccharide export system permease protein
MKILDRYIFLKYITTFFFCLIIFLVLSVVIDMSEHTDDFTKSGLSVWQITRLYYFGFIPRIGAMLFPLFVFLSVIFFTSKMAGRSEVIAILSSGTTYQRYLRPFIGGALLLAALLWTSYRYIVPSANKIFGDFHKNYLDKNSSLTSNDNSAYKQNIYFRIDNTSYLGIKSYDTISKTGSGIFIQKFDGNKLVYNVRASNFNWDTAQKKWKLTNVTERILHDINETVINVPSKLVNYNFKPVDLRKDEYLKDQMSTPELDNFINAERMRGSEMMSTLLVERYNRDAIPASVLILTIIGAVLASRKVRGGSGAHIALGVVLSMVYILFSKFSGVFATKGSFTPLLAAWVPNIIFGILAVYLYIKAPK